MNADSVRNCRQMDLDKLSKDFTKWQKKYQELLLQNSSMNQETEYLNRQCRHYKETGKSLQEEVKKLSEIITSLQDSLMKQCDLEGENKKLKESIISTEKSLEELKVENRLSLLQLESSLKEEHKKQQVDLEASHQQNIQQKEKEVHILKQTLQERLSDAQHLQRQITDTEKEKETEMVNLRREYDAKLQKLHKTNMRTLHQQIDNPNSAGSRIYREKMLNAQATSEKEVARLKQTVSELKRRLEFQQTSTSGKRKR